MFDKKTRIISFLMCLILVFSFAFLNPLTVAKSEAVFPIIGVLSTQGVKIIACILASAGIGITAGTALQELDYNAAIEDLSYVIYRTMNGAEKILLGALSVVDNIVDVPISLYNKVVDIYNKVVTPSENITLPTNFTTKYVKATSTNITYPSIVFPFYEGSVSVSNNDFVLTERKIDLREAQPFFVYKGIDTPVENTWYEEGVEYFFINSFPEGTELSNTVTGIALTPELASYKITGYTNTTILQGISLSEDDTNFTMLERSTNNSTTKYSNWKMIKLPKSSFGTSVLNDYNFYAYFVEIGSGYIYTVTDIYNKANGQFVQQVWTKYNSSNSSPYYTIPTQIRNSSITTPLNYDLTFEPETTIAPAIPNSDATGNIITMPTDVSSVVGITSTQVNAEQTTGGDDTTGGNTETMDRIDTNVGELVTGGELGESTNTNIETVEGIHGELMEGADFTGLTDVLTRYLEFINISSVGWLVSAIPLAVAPFLPFVSIGFVIFFIDRLLNGGA